MILDLLIGEDEGIILPNVRESESVKVVSLVRAKLQFRMNQRRLFGSEVQNVGRRPAVTEVRTLETSGKRVVEHAEEIDEVRFARAVRAVRADENIEMTQFYVRMLDRAEAFELKSGELFHFGGNLALELLPGTASSKRESCSL